MITIKTLNKKDYDVLTHLINFSQAQLQVFMEAYLKKYYRKVIVNKDYLIAKGNIPVALVAHMDTVHREKATKKDIYYDTSKNVIWSPDGLGADDRAGVFGIMKLLERGYKPTIFLTTDEEMGGLGAEAMVQNFPKCPYDLKYIIELDRRGSNDCVFYDCDNEKFEQYVETFGFATAWGSFSDISELCPTWKIAGVNLSIGYQNEHTNAEFLNINWMWQTINRVAKMFDDIKNAEHFKFIPRKYDYSYAYGYNGSYSNTYSGTWLKCDVCGKWVSDLDIIGVKNNDGTTTNCCIDCFDGTNIGWCNYCGTMYAINNEYPYEDVCPICHEKYNITEGK